MVISQNVKSTRKMKNLKNGRRWKKMTKEEKDKLIALSDLNREDNIKYISSEAQGIAIALDSDRYAPTFCKLERAYICGRRKSEEQIEKMKKYIKACWVEENLNDYSSYITNTSNEFRDLVKELNNEVRNGR